jgi:hypothetical protein
VEGGSQHDPMTVTSPPGWSLHGFNQAFMTALRGRAVDDADVGLDRGNCTSVSGAAGSFSAALDAALTASRRDALKHGTNAPYVAAVFARRDTRGSGWPRTADSLTRHSG